MKRIFAGAVCLALCLGLTACAGRVFPSWEGNTTASETQSDGVELKVVTSYGADDGNRKNYENAVAAYEASTGNRVNDDSGRASEEWRYKVFTDFETGSDPDVLFFFTNADAEPFIRAGKLVSIEEIRTMYPDYATNMKPSMMAVAEDGRHYAVPSTGYWENLFVNRRVLEESGVEIPGTDYTWEQFLRDCRKIKDAGFTPIACSLSEIPHYWLEFVIMNNGSLQTQQELPRLENGCLVMDDVAEKWIAALEDIKSLYDAGFFPGNTLTATDSETVIQFAEGKAAFLIDGSWKCGYFAENYPQNLEDYVVCCVPGKGERPATDTIGGISMGYFVTRKAWRDPLKRAAAVEFVSQLTSDETLSTFVTTEFTALKNGASPENLNALQQSAADCNAKLTGVVGAVQDTMAAEAKDYLFTSIRRIVTGKQTPADAIESAMKLNG